MTTQIENKMIWICVRTELKRETFAQKNLARTGLDIYCPRYERWIAHARRRERVARPLFPNYLFAGSAGGLEAMGHARRTPGVASLAGRDLASAVVPEAVIAFLRARETSSGFVELARFVPGDAIKITGGPLQGCAAIFHERQDERRSSILLSLLGRQHAVDVYSADLESAA
jgi:transcription antitermination factor NusG